MTNKFISYKKIDNIHRFMRDFDNFELAKEHYFEKIRSGEYVVF